MKRKLSITILLSLILIALLVVDCERSVSPHKGSGINLGAYRWDLQRSPRENREAEEMALWLSKRLVAPENLYQTILYQLTTIRAQYSDSIPQLTQIKFRSPWESGKILMTLTPDAWEQVKRGEYHDLDFLNASLKLTKMDTAWVSFNKLSVRLFFEGRLHPGQLVDLYVRVASVQRAQPNYIYGDGSNIYPSFSKTGVTYLFREAWGDCPAGCIYERFWCFEANGFDINYIGSWDPDLEPEPDWWGQAKIGIFRY